MATNVGSATGYLDLDISGFLAGLQSAQSAANRQTRNMATTIGNNISGMGNSLTSVGTTLTKTVTVPLVGIGVAGLKTAMNFEKGMSEVRAISGATGKDFDALREKAIDLGATTAFSAGEVASAMTEMAKAGWSSQQILDGMGGVLDAAAASGEGLASVATIVADAITGFGMQASDSTRVADLLTQAANSGTIGIMDLGESFKYIAPVAGSMGFSIEDVTTAIAAMSMAGIKGSQAGTALRTMLTNLVKPTEQMSVAMEELGISATNSDGSMKSLDEIVANLRTSFDGLTEAEKASYAATLAGKEGMSGLLAILNLTEEEYNAIAASMDNANGVAQETATIMQDNLQSKVEQLGGSLESLAIKLGDIVIPYVQQFVVWLTSLVEKFTALDPETQKTILKFAALAAVAGPLITVFGTLLSSLGTIITTFGKIPGAVTTVTTGFTNLINGGKRIFDAFNLARSGFTALAAQASPLGAALASVTGPMIAIVAAVAAVIAAFVSLWKNNEEFRNNIIAIWNQIKETFNSFAQGIVDRLNSLGFEFENFSEVFEAITDVLKQLWQGFCDFLAPIFEGAFQLIADVFKFATDQILSIFDFWVAVFRGDWEGAWDAVKNVFENAWNFIKSTFQNILNVMKGILDVACSWFGTTWSATWNNIKTFFSNTWNNIKTTASNAINSVKTTISNGLNSAKSTVTSIFDSIKNKISSTLDSAKNTVKSGIDKIKSFFNFEWSLPRLKLPHFTISGSFSLNPPSVPSFGISWYKKAMSSGMILNSPTIFGFDPTTGKFLGGGEAGSETVVGTSNLMKMIRSAVNDAIAPMVEATYQLTKVSHELGYITNNAFARQTQIFERIMRNRSDETGGGHTFNFYSPEAIDEVEAAHQMKKAMRELAEGF